MKFILFLASALIGSWFSVSAKNTVVEVTNARELIEALGSNRTIYLKSGIYNISNNDSLYQLSAWYSRDTSFSSRGAVFHDLKNVKFIGIGGVKIITNNYFEWVVNFMNCKGLYFENMTIGHDTPSECEGGTAYFKNSSDIILKKVGLYGCGTVGLELNNIEDFHISESEIFKCTYNLIEIRGSKNVRFNEVTFRESGQTDMLIFDKNGRITFNHCIFRDNAESELYRSSTMGFIRVEEANASIDFNKCQFINNQYDFFCNDISPLRVISCTFENNGFGTIENKTKFYPTEQDH